MRIEKVIQPASMQTSGGRWVRIYCKIKYIDGRLSISGVIGPLPSGNALGGAGQIDMGFAHKNPQDDDTRWSNLTKPEELIFTKGWDTDLWLDFLDIWKEWHLNDLQAGCIHQREMGWSRDGYDKHPSEPCPICGYKYGTAWLKKDVPESVILFLDRLPKAKQRPAWI